MEFSFNNVYKRLKGFLVGVGSSKRKREEEGDLVAEAAPAASRQRRLREEANALDNQASTFAPGGSEAHQRDAAGGAQQQHVSTRMGDSDGPAAAQFRLPSATDAVLQGAYADAAFSRPGSRHQPAQPAASGAHGPHTGVGHHHLQHEQAESTLRNPLPRGGRQAAEAVSGGQHYYPPVAAAAAALPTPGSAGGPSAYRPHPVAATPKALQFGSGGKHAAGGDAWASGAGQWAGSGGRPRSGGGAFGALARMQHQQHQRQQSPRVPTSFNGEDPEGLRRYQGLVADGGQQQQHHHHISGMQQQQVLPQPGPVFSAMASKYRASRFGRPAHLASPAAAAAHYPPPSPSPSPAFGPQAASPATMGASASSAAILAMAQLAVEDRAQAEAREEAQRKAAESAVATQLARDCSGRGRALLSSLDERLGRISIGRAEAEVVSVGARSTASLDAAAAAEARIREDMERDRRLKEAALRSRLADRGALATPELLPGYEPLPTPPGAVAAEAKRKAAIVGRKAVAAPIPLEEEVVELLSDDDEEEVKEEKEVSSEEEAEEEDENTKRYWEVVEGGGDPGQVLVEHKGSGVELQRRHAACMAPMTWLNDEAVNLFLGLLQERDARYRKQGGKQRWPTCHFWNSFFMNKLTMDAGRYSYNNVRRWTTPSRLKAGGQLSEHPFECDTIFFPINISQSHWAAAVIRVKHKEIVYLDSLHGRNDGLLRDLARWVADEYRQRYNKEVDTSEWQLVSRSDIPRQHNGSDCGMFMLTYAEHEGRGAAFDFEQKDIQRLRVSYVNQMLRKRVD